MVSSTSTDRQAGRHRCRSKALPANQECGGHTSTSTLQSYNCPLYLPLRGGCPAASPDQPSAAVHALHTVPFKWWGRFSAVKAAGTPPQEAATFQIRWAACALSTSLWRSHPARLELAQFHAVVLDAARDLQVIHTKSAIRLEHRPHGLCPDSPAKQQRKKQQKKSPGGKGVCSPTQLPPARAFVQATTPAPER